MTETVDHDLFGNPVQALKDPRGRKSFGKSKENQLVVMTMKAAGWTQEKIATFLGCDVKTLRKHFSLELDAGAIQIEGMALQVLVRKMMGGNLSAARDLITMSQAQSPRVKPVAIEPKDEPLGKKEQAKLDAKSSPSGWAEVLGNDGRLN